MLFDVNNDGYISFKEEIDKEEFKKVMALMRACNRQGSQHRGGLRFGFKTNSADVENGGLVEYFFGEDGNAKLQLDKFIKFLKDLQDEVCDIDLSDNVVEIIFHVFDSNRDGHISSRTNVVHDFK